MAIVSEEHMLQCPLREMTGFDCPGCGFQRSFMALINGDVVQSLELFPGLIPMLLMFVLLGIHLIFKLKNGPGLLKWNFVLVGALVFGNFVYKLLL
jgi:hypothetical protein